MTHEPAARSRPRVTVVMPAYNAALTLEKTVRDIPPGSVDEVVLVDDGSRDATVEIARRLGLRVIEHAENRGYGANQKTCYTTALQGDADVVVMIHPDYQYDSRVIPQLVTFLELGICDVMLGSRIRTRREALDGGMPPWKYLANWALTVIENVLLGQNLGDFHSGLRAYRREVLETVPFLTNSDDFVFDTQFLVQCVYFGFRLGDLPVPVRYFAEASSIDFRRTSATASQRSKRTGSSGSSGSASPGSTSSSLGRHLKTGHTSTCQNRPTGSGRRDGWGLPHAVLRR